MMPFPEQRIKLKWLESNLICCVMVTPRMEESAMPNIYRVCHNEAQRLHAARLTSFLLNERFSFQNGIVEFISFQHLEHT